MGKAWLGHTANLTPAGSESTKIFLMSYRAIGSGPGNTSGGGGGEYTHIVQNIIFNLDRPIFVQGALDITRPDDCMREVRYFETG